MINVSVILLVCLYECKWSMLLHDDYLTFSTNDRRGNEIFFSTYFAHSLYAFVWSFKCWASDFYHDVTTKPPVTFWATLTCIQFCSHKQKCLPRQKKKEENHKIFACLKRTRPHVIPNMNDLFFHGSQKEVF